VTLWLCVAPLRLGGLRGKKSTPSVWLGGTGELLMVGKQGARSWSWRERKRDNHSDSLPIGYGTPVCHFSFV
jgi:hypothetical protein